MQLSQFSFLANFTLYWLEPYYEKFTNFYLRPTVLMSEKVNSKGCS